MTALPEGGVILAANHPNRWDSLLAARLLNLPNLTISEGEIVVGRTETQSLQRGTAVLVFVEGGRSPDGALHRARTDVSRLAAITGAPVVPIAFHRGWPVGVSIGEPLREPLPEGASEEALRRHADLVSAAILVLSGQPYVDVDVQARRRQLRTQRRAVKAERRAELQRAAAEAEARRIDYVTEAEELAAAREAIVEQRRVRTTERA